MYEYKAVIVNVVDGDTFDMNIDLGFNIHIHERVRLLNIDTPENRGAEKKLGKAVTQYAKKHFEGVKKLFCDQVKIKQIVLDVGLQKYILII